MREIVASLKWYQLVTAKVLNIWMYSMYWGHWVDQIKKIHKIFNIQRNDMFGKPIVPHREPANQLKASVLSSRKIIDLIRGQVHVSEVRNFLLSPFVVENK